jgi:DNA-binding Lrp family transcriptional regulator
MNPLRNGIAAPIEFDEIDQRIIALLREDGRMPFRSIARTLELTETTVRARVRRLEASNAMKVVAVTDFQAAGYDLLLAVGVQVEGRSPQAVAQDLAALREVFSVNVVIGTHDIELLVVAEDQAALAELMTRRLARVAGVRRLAPALAMNVVKNQPDWVPFHGAPFHGAGAEAGDGL